MKHLTLISFIIINAVPILGQQPQAASTNIANISNDLVSPEGLSEMRFVFKPGLIVGSETVAKTFQPSYIVTSKGTMLVFCQGRLRKAGDNEVKVILMNTSRDYGKTWEGVLVLSSP